MKKMTYRVGSVLLALSTALASVACGGGDKLTAENVTLEECQELFPEDSTEEIDETDYDGDDDVDEDDAAIVERCDELMEEAEGTAEDGSEG